MMSQDGCTPVYMAAMNGHRDTLEYLVSVGADVHAADKVSLHHSYKRR
jgi:ankyrin repeat protein